MYLRNINAYVRNYIPKQVNIILVSRLLWDLKCQTGLRQTSPLNTKENVNDFNAVVAKSC
jgi:hypothetical protein